MIYITDERWEHIYERHPEVIGYEEYVLKTLRTGTRKQQPLEPDVFKYSKQFGNLPEGHTHVVVVVRMTQKINAHGQAREDNFVITAYLK